MVKRKSVVVVYPDYSSVLGWCFKNILSIESMLLTADLNHKRWSKDWKLLVVQKLRDKPKRLGQTCFVELDNPMEFNIDNNSI